MEDDSFLFEMVPFQGDMEVPKLTGISRNFPKIYEPLMIFGRSEFMLKTRDFQKES